MVSAILLWPKISIAAAGICLLWAIYLARAQRLAREMAFRSEAQTAERMRMVAELHDRLLQLLQELALSFSNATAQADMRADVRDEMKRALEGAEELLVSGRNRVRDLQPDLVARKDFAAGAHSLIDDRTHRW
jgi:signal transduction histidine kinase